MPIISRIGARSIKVRLIYTAIFVILMTNPSGDQIPIDQRAWEGPPGTFHPPIRTGAMNPSRAILISHQ